MIRHFVIGPAIRPALRTDGLSLIWLQVMQQMKSKVIVYFRELDAANAANGFLEISYVRLRLKWHDVFCNLIVEV